MGYRYTKHNYIYKDPNKEVWRCTTRGNRCNANIVFTKKESDNGDDNSVYIVHFEGIHGHKVTGYSPDVCQFIMDLKREAIGDYVSDPISVLHKIYRSSAFVKYNQLYNSSDKRVKGATGVKEATVNNAKNVKYGKFPHIKSLLQIIVREREKIILFHIQNLTI